MIHGVNTRTLDDRLRHIESVVDLLDRHMVELIASYGDPSRSWSSHEGHPRGDMLGEADAGTAWRLTVIPAFGSGAGLLARDLLSVRSAPVCA
jgi:hypothetical protein